MKIYIRMEPQPEIEMGDRGTFISFYIKDSDWEGGLLIDKPYQPGDEIDVVHTWSGFSTEHDAHIVTNKIKKFKVKSIAPVNCDGVFEWEIDAV